MKDLLKSLLGLICVLVVIWFIVAEAVFGFRHPWATDTERFLHAGEAMLFKKVPYHQMRPRE